MSVSSLGEWTAEPAGKKRSADEAADLKSQKYANLSPGILVRKSPTQPEWQAAIWMCMCLLLNHSFLQRAEKNPQPLKFNTLVLEERGEIHTRKGNIHKSTEDDSPIPFPPSVCALSVAPCHPPPLFNVSNFMPCSLPLSARLSKADRRIPLVFRVLKPLSRSDSLFYSATL